MFELSKVIAERNWKWRFSNIILNLQHLPLDQNMIFQISTLEY